MPRKIKLHPLVASDVGEAIAWYEERCQGLGERFRSAVNRRLDDIAESPNLFPRAFDDRDYRFARLSRFPYLILFHVRRQTLSVLGVFHSATDPKKWRRRGG
jgi:hypothetical protein